MRYHTIQCPHIKNICVGFAFVRVLKLSVADEDGVHVAAGILVQLLVAGDHDDSDLHIAEDAQLVGFLQQASFTLAEGNLTCIQRVHKVNTCMYSSNQM